MNTEHGAITPGKTFDTLKTVIADKLEHAAGSIDEQTQSMGVTGACSRQASEWLRHSAAYVREVDLQKADMELRNRIRTHPGRSVLIGLAAGLLAGIWLQRR